MLIKWNSTHFQVKKREDENLRDKFFRDMLFSTYNPLHKKRRERKKTDFNFSSGHDVAQDWRIIIMNVP